MLLAKLRPNNLRHLGWKGKYASVLDYSLPLFYPALMFFEQRLSEMVYLSDNDVHVLSVLHSLSLITVDS